MEVSIFIPYLLKEKERWNGVKPAARAVGIDAQSYDNYINGITKEIRGKNERILCNYFRIATVPPSLSSPVPVPSWELKALFEAMQKQIDSLQSRMDILERRDHLKRSG